MDAFFAMHPYLEAAALVFGVWAAVPLVAAAVLSAGGLVGRAGVSSMTAYTVSGVLFAAAVAGSQFLPLGDGQTAAFVALVGGAGIVALGAGFRSGHAERAVDYDMRVSEGLLSLSLLRERNGVRTRLMPKQGGGRDEIPTAMNTRRIPNDALEVETAVPALGRVRVVARWDGQLPAFVPVLLRENFADLFDRTMPPRVERSLGDELCSWPGRWRFRENAPGAAARLFGRCAPPLVGGGRLYLDSVEIRDGVLRCRYEKRFITSAAVAEAEESVRDFASRLTR